jgi:Flp pilus assembly protein TadD
VCAMLEPMLASSVGLCSVLAWMLILAPAAPPSAAAGRAVASAEAALASGQPREALTFLDEALRVEPENADALMLLGRTMLGLERHEESATAFRRAAEVRGETTGAGLDALCALADALTRQGHSREAIATLLRVRETAPRRPSVNHDLGRIYLVVGELEAAARSFRQELDLKPEGPPRGASDPVTLSSWEGLGLAAYRMGDDDLALEALSKAPPTLDAKYHTGMALLRKGRSEEALAALREVLDKDAENRGALQAVARAAGALGRDDERKEALARFAAIYKKDEEQRALRVKILELRTQAESLAQAGDVSTAVARLEEAARLSPSDMDIVLSLGRLLYASRDLPRAEKAFREVLEHQPTHADARYRLGRLQAETGDFTSAVQSLELACRMSPMTLSYHVHLAKLYMREARAADAVRELRLARRLSPGDPDSAYNLGLGLAQAGAFAEAAAELEAAVAQGHKDPRVHQVLAGVYARMGDAARAKQAEETFRRLSGSPPGGSAP